MKRITVWIPCILFTGLLIFPVFAHPGNTDSSGGHTNHSTGDYHYHHGYSAHDHYDMDGDGKVDCPYDFVDRTDTSRKESSGSYIRIGTPLPTNVTKNTDPPTESEPVPDTTEKDGIIVPVWILFPLAFIILMQWSAIRKKIR